MRRSEATKTEKAELADTLSELKDRLNVSDEELARRLGVSLRTMARWKSGRTKQAHYAHERAIAKLKDSLPETKARPMQP